MFENGTPVPGLSTNVLPRRNHNPFNYRCVQSRLLPGSQEYQIEPHCQTSRRASSRAAVVLEILGFVGIGVTHLGARGTAG